VIKKFLIGLAVLCISTVAFARATQKSLKTVVITPTASSTPNYTSGDQIGASNPVSSATLDPGGFAILKSISVLDKESQSLEMDVYFFSETPGESTLDNEAASVSDANAVSKGFLGVVNIPAANYAALAANSIAKVDNLSLVLKAAAGSTTVYCLVVTRGAHNLATNNDLVFTLGLEQ
jgi:hypothetical protein